MSYLRTHSIFLGFSALAALALAIGCSQSADDGDSTSADDTAGDASTDGGLPVQDLVISQIYGGGGNASATFQNDFVELFNRSDKTIALKGYALQYIGYDKPFLNNTSVLTLPDAATLDPGHYYLIQLAGAANLDASAPLNGAKLPAPDYTATAALELINLSQSDGKIALVPANALLNNCGAAGSLCPASSFYDMVGFGKATQFEGAPVPTLYTQGQAAQAAIRKLGGCMAFYDNQYDFTVGTAAPRNGTTMPSPVCSNVDAGAPPPPPDLDAGTDGGGSTKHDGGSGSSDGGRSYDGGKGHRDGGRGTTAGDDDDGLDTPDDPSADGDNDPQGSAPGAAADGTKPPAFPATSPNCSTTMTSNGGTSFAGLFGLALVAGALRRRKK